MNNLVLGETVKTVRKHRNIKIVATRKRRNYLVSKQNHYTTKFFTEHLLTIEIKKLKYSGINLFIYDFQF